MSHEIFASDLFSNISEEQEQIVAGGGLLPHTSSIDDYVNTNYSAQNDIQSFKFYVSSTGNGSVVAQQFVNQSTTVDTSTNKWFQFWN